MMLAKRIIPFIEVSEGKTVVSPAAAEMRAAADPVELARFYEAAGADELVIYDLTVASTRTTNMDELVERMGPHVFLPIAIGGSVESKAQIRSLLRAGADRVILDDATHRRPDLIAEAAQLVGSDRLAILISARKKRVPVDAIDAKPPINGSTPTDASGADYEVCQGLGAKSSGRDAVAWAIEVAQRGAGEILLHCADKIGTRQGYDLELIRKVADAVPIPVIVVGGAGTPAHFVELFRTTRTAGAMASGIFHVRESSIKRIKRDCLDAQIAVRPLPLEAEAPVGASASGELPVRHAEVPTPPGPTRPGTVGDRP